MLYVNGELLNTRNRAEGYKYNEFVTEYYELALKLRKQFGDVLHIQTRQKMRVDSKTRYPRYPAAKGLLKQASVATDSGVYEWIYSPHTLKVDDGVVVLDEPNIIIDKGEFFINIVENPDLAFFCFYTKKVALNEHLPGKFHIVDLEGKNQDEADKLRLEGKLANLIFSSIPEENLKTLAKSWGIPGVETKPLETVRVELHAKVLFNDESNKKGGAGKFRGVQDFIDSSEVGFYDQVAALVRDAEEKGRLLFEPADRRWVIDYEDGHTPYILKELSGSEVQTPVEALISFLISENEKLRKLEESIGKVAKRKESPKSPEITQPIATATLTMEEVQVETNYARLKSMAKKYIPEFIIEKGVGNDEIKQALMAKIASEEVIQEPQG